MSVLMAFGWISLSLLAGMLLRGKLGFLQKMLVPSCVIGGIIGFLLVNLNLAAETDTSLYSTLVAQVFIISFISIGLTTPPKEDAGAGKNLLKGGLGIGIVWDLLYALTPVLGVLVAAAVGPAFGMDPQYGLLIPFAFAQGPGQSVTYGTILEGYGLKDAAMVAVAFSAIGFLFAFLVGVPLARRGLRCGAARHGGTLSAQSLKGVIPAAEQKEPIGVFTCHNSNIDPLAFHMALTFFVYLLTYFFTKLMKVLLRGSDLAEGMMFVYGLGLAYLVSFLMKKLGLSYLHDNETQKRITGVCTDYLVVGSFMAVRVSVIARWLVPMLAVCAVCAGVTYVVSYFFARRFGGSNDFERFLGLWGTATGTAPSGLALVRIVDPELATTTAAELGVWNVPGIFSYASVTVILMIGTGTLNLWTGLLFLLVPIPFYLLILKVAKLWNKPTFSLRKPK